MSCIQLLKHSGNPVKVKFYLISNVISRKYDESFFYTSGGAGAFLWYSSIRVPLKL